MITEFASKRELRRRLPPRLPRNGETRYVYLLRRSKAPCKVKIGITCNPLTRMCEWFGEVGPIWISGPLDDAIDREIRLIAEARKLGRRDQFREEVFIFSRPNLEIFLRIFVKLTNSFESVTQKAA